MLVRAVGTRSGRRGDEPEEGVFGGWPGAVSEFLVLLFSCSSTRITIVNPAFCVG